MEAVSQTSRLAKLFGQNGSPSSSPTVFPPGTLEDQLAHRYDYVKVTRMSHAPPGTVYRFGPFQYDSAQRLLYRDDVLVPLVPKAADTRALALIAGLVSFSLGSAVLVGAGFTWAERSAMLSVALSAGALAELAAGILALIAICRTPEVHYAS